MQSTITELLRLAASIDLLYPMPIRSAAIKLLWDLGNMLDAAENQKHADDWREVRPVKHTHQYDKSNTPRSKERDMAHKIQQRHSMVCIVKERRFDHYYRGEYRKGIEVFFSDGSVRICWGNPHEHNYTRGERTCNSQ